MLWGEKRKLTWVRHTLYARHCAERRTHSESYLDLQLALFIPQLSISTRSVLGTGDAGHTRSLPHGSLVSDAIGCSFCSSPDHASWEVLAAMACEAGLLMWWKCKEVSGRAQQAWLWHLCRCVQGSCRESLGDGRLSPPAPSTLTVSWPITLSFAHHPL